MKIKHVAFTLSFVLLAALISLKCKKSEETCTDNGSFCSINTADFTYTKTIVNEYLKTQSNNLSNQNKLYNLVDYLSCKTCVSKVTIECQSCPGTSPVQSKLNVDLFVNGQSVKKVFNISMGSGIELISITD